MNTHLTHTTPARTSIRLAQALLTLALVAGGAASAQAAGFYAGGSLAAPDYHGSINGIGDSNSSSGTGLKLYGGYQYTPNLAVEGGYFNLGRSENTSGTVKAQGLYVDGVGSVELAPSWSVLGSVGLAEGRFTTSAGDDHSPALKVGLGVQYDLSPSTALRLGYDRYHFTNVFDDKANIGQTSIGVKVGF